MTRIRRVGNDEVYENDRRADEVGYKAKQLNVRDDAPINPFGLNAQINDRVHDTELGNVVQSREEKENQRLKELYTILGEEAVDLGDLLEGLNPFELKMNEGQFRKMRAMAAKQRHQQLVEDTDSYDDEGFMNDYVQPAMKKAGGSWKLHQMEAKLKAGGTIPVWKVYESKTKTQIGHVFRIQEAAERAQTILNQSGNISDPRLVKLIESEKRHTTLIKELRQVRTAIREGNGSLKGKQQQLLMELEQINQKLGI